MATTRKRAPFKKRLLAKYINWLEAAGFLMIGTLIAGMVASTVYKIDDAMKFTNAPVSPRKEPVALPTEAFVDAVETTGGAAVKTGQVLLRASTDANDLAVLRAAAAIRTAEEALRAAPTDAATTAAVAGLLQEALAKAVAVPRNKPPEPVVAPVDGEVVPNPKQPLDSLQGKIATGDVATIISYGSLRFPVPVTGDNALRVRMNLLAEQDVLDWKLLTRQIRSENPPEDPATRRVWDLLSGKLDEVRPGATPLKRAMPEIVGALNEILRKPDFYEAKAWQGKQLPPEARQLLEKGPAKLPADELIRLNRLQMELALPGAIAPGANIHQEVKAKLYIPVQHRTPEGKIVKDPPKVFNVSGTVVHEPVMGQVLIDLPNPPAEVVDHLKLQAKDPSLPGVTTTGIVVVGRISLFRFLFK
jgi:hypothetical protein